MEVLNTDQYVARKRILAGTKLYESNLPDLLTACTYYPCRELLHQSIISVAAVVP